MNYGKFITEMQAGSEYRTLEQQEHALDTYLNLEFPSSMPGCNAGELFENYSDINMLLGECRDLESGLDSIICWAACMLRDARSEVYELLSNGLLREVVIVNGNRRFNQSNCGDLTIMCR